MSLENIQKKIDEVKTVFESSLTNLKSNVDVQAVDDMRVQFLGKKGHFSGLMSSLKDVSGEQKPEAGKLINDLRQHVTKHIEDFKKDAKLAEINQKIKHEKIDVTLDAPSMNGSLHPVSLLKNKCLEIFRQMGFVVGEGPEVDFDFYNFSALNIPANHPARDMQDTFYVENSKGDEDWYLRTHTSNVQIHTMLNEPPPLRIIAPGRTYRVDNDPTHTPMFHQIEGFVVDEGISFAHLKGTIEHWIKALFGEKAKTRFRPSFFPFVEPGAELDMSCVICSGSDSSCRVCKGTGWLEIGGCGMIHPNIFTTVNYNTDHYSGFAFGFGLDRMAMLYYGLDDLRLLFDGIQSYLSQFPIYIAKDRTC